jgi:peptidyl-tRNA hydrolase
LSENNREIENQLRMAKVAKEKGMDSQVVLATRKAARLRESNEKYESLLSKMDILDKVLKKMYNASEFLLEDTKDQVKMREEERKAIRASHSAMKSAINIITGNNDQRALFDQALESVADDVAMKVGEMERFMELSEGFMNSVDLQNGVFEEEGLKMLEKFETSSLFLGSASKQTLQLDSNRPEKVPIALEASSNGNEYDKLFNEG